MNVAMTSSVNDLNDSGFFFEDKRDVGEPFKLERGSSKARDILGITKRQAVIDDETPGLASQINLLFMREVRNLYRETHALKARFAMTVMISLIIGCIFYQVADEDHSDYVVVQSTFGGLLMALLANVLATTLPSLAAFPAERPVFLREYSTNHYCVLAYFLSRLTMELFVNAVQVTVSCCITYFLMGLEANFGMFWTSLYLMACSATAMGMMVGSAVENPAVAVEFLPALFVPQTLLSGFAVPAYLMPSWLSWLRWIYPLTYGVKIVVAMEFNGKCDGLGTINYCDQVMDNVESDIDHVGRYILVMSCIFVVFRLGAFALLKSKANKFIE